MVLAALLPKFLREKLSLQRKALDGRGVEDYLKPQTTQKQKANLFPRTGARRLQNHRHGLLA